MKRRRTEPEMPTIHSEFDSLRLEMELELEKIFEKLDQIQDHIKIVEEMASSFPLLLELLIKHTDA